MAIYKTTFEEDPIGSLLSSGWTQVWNTGNASWDVVGSISGYGGKHVNQTQTVNDDRGVRYNPVPTFTNGEILAKLIFSQKTMYQNHLHLRLAGNGSDKTSYYAAVSYDGGEDRIYLEQWLNNNYYYITHAVTSYSQNNWYWMRFRADGRRLRVKFWAYGSPEPAGWLIDYTDNTGTYNGSAGRAALGSYQQDGTRRWDYVSITTNGETAPFPDQQDERGAVVTGKMSTHRDVNASTAGKALHDDERSAAVSGSGTYEDERGASLNAEGALQDERSAALTGESANPTSQNERSATLQALDHYDDEINVSLKAGLPTHDEYHATLIGKAEEASTRLAIVTGFYPGGDERSASVIGYDILGRERAAQLVGQAPFGNQRSAQLYGRLGAIDNRNAVVTGARRYTPVPDIGIAEPHPHIVQTSSGTEPVIGFEHIKVVVKK